jgi:hypothetical protein
MTFSVPLEKKLVEETTYKFNDYCDEPVLQSMFCLPVIKTELSTLMSKLNAAKSPGPDNIGPKLVKEAAHLLTEPLTYIFNLSLSNGTVPDKLKLAKVIPVFKKGDPKCLANYRPISLLSTFNKLLEKIIYVHLYYYLHHTMCSTLISLVLGEIIVQRLLLLTVFINILTIMN